MSARIAAYRGASKSKPENTMAAFDAAVEAGADVLHLDVQSTSDGELVVIHDYDLERTTNGEGLVVSRNVEYLQELEATSWFDAELEPEGLPLLVDVFEKYSGTMRFSLELRGFSPDYVHAVMETALTARLTDDVFITSPQLPLLLLARDQHPDARIAIPTPIFEPEMNRALRQALLLTNVQLIDGDLAVVPVDLLDSYLVDRLRDLDVEVQAFGCNTEADINKAMQLEIEEISTTDPSLAASHTAR